MRFLEDNEIAEWCTERDAARARHQERRSLETAPGHLVTCDERNALIEFVTLVMANGWEADVLPDAGRGAAARRIFISRDEWCAVEEVSQP